MLGAYKWGKQYCMGGEVIGSPQEAVCPAGRVALRARMLSPSEDCQRLLDTGMVGTPELKP